MTDAAPPPIRRRQLAIRLLELRRAAGLNQDQVVAQSGLSRSTISKIENAEQQIREKNVRLLAHAYGVAAPELDMLLRMAAEAKNRGSYLAHSDVAPNFARDYFELEAYASELWSFDTGYVPGLFQIPDYIRAVTQAINTSASDEELQRLVELRTSRQARLTSETPPLVHFVVDEAVIRRPVGGPAVMAAQIAHLVKASQLPTVTFQVLPFDIGAHPAMGSAFSVLRFEGTPGMDVVYVEGIRSAVYHEKPQDRDEYVRIFKLVSDQALSPDESRLLLATLARAYGSDR